MHRELKPTQNYTLMNTLLLIENTGFWLGWPWMGLGGAVVMIILLFCTDVLRSNREVSRWRDPLWLAWLAVPMYLIHQFEEYSLHIVDGQYSIVSMFFAPDGPTAAFGEMNLPLAHFPMMNCVFVWVAIPLGAWLFGKKHPAVALAPFGFILANGLLHLMQSLVGGMPVSENGGFWSGVLLFIPIAIWVIYVCAKDLKLSAGAIVISMLSGLLAHVILAGCYFFAIIDIPAGVIVMDILTSFAATFIALGLCKLCKIKKF